jgi:hypothetical protein
VVAAFLKWGRESHPQKKEFWFSELQKKLEKTKGKNKKKKKKKNERRRARREMKRKRVVEIDDDDDDDEDEDDESSSESDAGPDLDANAFNELLVVGFAKRLFEFEDQRSEIVRIWGLRPVDGKTGASEALTKLMENILTSRVDLELTPHYLQIFYDCPALRVRASFDCPGGLDFSRLRRFKYNHKFEEGLDRKKLALDIVHSSVMAGIELEGGKFSQSVRTSCILAIKKLHARIVPTNIATSPEAKRLGVFFGNLITDLRSEEVYRKMKDERERYAYDL